YLTLIGGVLGIALGLLIVQYFEKEGLDLSNFADALAQFGYEAVVFPTVTQQDIIVVLILVIITSVSAAIIPTLRAIYLNPAEAIRK
ncbi:MAG: ABC transporter permease, partial [Cyclobacteriaceae bacterium]|nr:ABC transporter permease [Cyclobacteriaceae bacterium]